MPNIDIRCLSCGEVSEVFRHNSAWPKTPACPKCDAATEQIHRPSYERSCAPAVVVFKAPDGSMRFPGDPNGLSAKQYERQGFTRIEARGWAEVRRLEKTVNQQEASKIRQRIERHQACREEGARLRRSEVYAGMANGFVIPEVDERGHRTGRLKTVRMSEQGKDILREAMQRNDRRSPSASSDAGFRVEAFSENRSNRDESRGSDGRRMRD